MDILSDEEKTSEDLMKDTNIEEQIRAREEDESIIESTDINTLINDTDDFIESLNNLDDLLKDLDASSGVSASDNS